MSDDPFMDLFRLLSAQQPQSRLCPHNPCKNSRCKLSHVEGQAAHEVPCRFGDGCRYLQQGFCQYKHTDSQRAHARRVKQQQREQREQKQPLQQQKEEKDRRGPFEQHQRQQQRQPKPHMDDLFASLLGSFGQQDQPAQEEPPAEKKAAGGGAKNKRREKKDKTGDEQSKPEPGAGASAAGAPIAGEQADKDLIKQARKEKKLAAKNAKAEKKQNAKAETKAKEGGKDVCANGNECKAFWSGKCRKHTALLDQLHMLYIAHKDMVDAAVQEEESEECPICLEPVGEPGAQAAGAMSCIQLPCSHQFHRGCLLGILESKWNGPRITFGFCRCPLCAASLLELPDLSLQHVLAPIRELHSKVQRKALMRLEHDGLAVGVGEADRAAMAMERYAYYQCFKCAEPYFGGEGACEAARGAADFNPAELLCPRCCGAGPREHCPHHGAEFLEYKCRYCCSVAVFFCFGSTHFCSKCHDNHSTLTGATPDRLPRCPAGPVLQQLPGDECPLHVYHPPTGQEYALGCGLCRNAQTF